jgi:hypothetical protein
VGSSSSSRKNEGGRRKKEEGGRNNEEEKGIRKFAPKDMGPNRPEALSYSLGLLQA